MTIVFSDVMCRFGPVRGLTVSIPTGQTTALLGPPGAAVLDLVAGRRRPDAGSVVVDGVRVDTLSRRERMRYRRGIGVVVGYPQRLDLGRVFAHRPAVVLADEPTAGLDRVTAGAVLDMLIRMTARCGATLLLATVDEAVAARCRRVIHLRDGVVVGDDQPASDSAATRRWIEGPAVPPAPELDH